MTADLAPVAYTFAHVNDITLDALKAILPEPQILDEGDCGSVWGEHHAPHSPCPFPHLVIVAPSRDDLEALVAAGVGFSADLAPLGSEQSVQWAWTEDPECLERDADHRQPHPPKDGYNGIYWPLCEACRGDVMDELACPNSHHRLCVDCCGEDH